MMNSTLSAILSIGIAGCLASCILNLFQISKKTRRIIFVTLGAITGFLI